MKPVLAPIAVALLALSACQPAPAVAPPQGYAVSAPRVRADSALEVWLAQHPSVAGAIVWETERGPLPWARWDDARRRALEAGFVAATASLQGQGDPAAFPLQDPPPNLAAFSRNETVLAAGDAFRLYAAHVGHSLALEILRTVPWSLTADPPDVLQALLDGRSMFVFRPDLGGYALESARAGWVVPAPPAVELSFLTREHLLGQTRLATIEALVAWSQNLHHVRGRLDLDNAETVWQYRGFAPVSRVLAGSGADHRHVTAGCWGTTGFLVAVLRAANVPARLVNVGARARPRACSHAQPYFVSERRYLSHGDDPYSRLVSSPGEGAVSPERLLIDQATWTAWYGEGVDPAEVCTNIGRQPREIALQTLPPYLMEQYCEDERQRGDRRSGHVARAFGVDRPGSAFPLARLERERLWERLAEKARATQACSKKPAAAPGPGVEAGPEGE
jgi:hypothetical protein